MRRFLIGLAVMGLVLAGCGDDDDDGASTSTTGGSTTTEASGAADSVDITMSDFAYAVSGSVKAGGTLNLKNAGKEFHMLGVGKFKDGKTIDDLRAALAQEPAEGEGDEESDPTADIVDEVELPIGSIFSPGQGAALTVPDFGAGQYALICFIPSEGGGPPHFAKGMVNTLTVEPEKATEPTADAIYTIAPGKAIEGPKALAAGRHTLKISAAAGSEELEPVLAKPDEGKTVADMDKVFDTIFADELPANAASLVPGDVVVGAFDMGPAKTMYMTVDLEPGTYTLFAQDSDDDDAPSDPVEKILITVK